MTILVSDMGDTVISSFKRGTFKLGDLTVLPKAGLWHDLLKSNRWLWNWMSRRVESNRDKKGLPVGPSTGVGVPELTIEDLADYNPSEAEMTKRLAWAIRRTADDLQHSPGKRYTYEQWVEFTHLIRFSRVGLETCVEASDGVVEWDWLGDSSPMLSGQTESEWILDRLCESLLRLLKKNMLGLTGTPTSAHPASATSENASTFSFSRQPTFFDDSIWENTGSRVPGKNRAGPATDTDGQAHHDSSRHAHSPPSPAEERRRRASGADALLTFFTGDRRGTHTYVSDAPQWSKKAQERAKERRRSSGGATVRRRGPFSSLAAHGGPSGAVGGGRGGAGARTLKMRHFAGDGSGAQGARVRD